MLGTGNSLADHMAVHIVSMNLAAPLAAMAWRALSVPARPAATHPLALATVFQILLLWGWHAPPVLQAALASPALHWLMQISVFAAALWFWACVFEATGARRWRALFALLVTGKLFCLLGVLLVFAPRALYALDLAGHMHGAAGSPLEDQQLAGLLMIVACPLTYVLAGVVIAARWVLELDDQPTASPPSLRRTRTGDAV
jgi:putative membrane protein